MPDIDQLVEFLDRREALQLGESPWRPPPDDSDAYELDWERLFDEPDDREGSQLEPIDNWDSFGELADTFGPWIGRRPEARDHEEVPVIESEAHFCAWYQPIHYHGYDFGIFIRRDCALKWARWVSRYLPKQTPLTPLLCRQLVRAGVSILFLHEHYHHKVESLGLRLHVATGKSCYLPYQTSVYRACIGSDDQLEEALANADAFARLSEDRYRKGMSRSLVKAAREYLEWAFPSSPPGYRMAIQYLYDPSFDAAEDVLQERVRLATLKVPSAADWVCAPQMTRSILTVREPIWWLVPRGARPLVPVTSTPIRTCSSRELEKLCLSRGYQRVDGGKGSHVKLKRAGSPMVIIPGDRDNVSPGVARATLRALGEENVRALPDLVGRL